MKGSKVTGINTDVLTYFASAPAIGLFPCTTLKLFPEVRKTSDTFLFNIMTEIRKCLGKIRKCFGGGREEMLAFNR